MFGIDLNNAVVDICKRLIAYLPGIQNAARRRLVNDLQQICSKCDDAYSAVLVRLTPVKQAYSDPPALARELRSFAGDPTTRAAFKPEHLCGEIDHLLQELRNNLAALGYAVGYSGLDELAQILTQMGNYDNELYHQYDRFTSSLDDLATRLEQTSGAERAAWLRYAQELISDTRAQLSESVRRMRNAKDLAQQTAF